nr:unnamed protein product [Callosobruchus analis]
MSQIKICHVNVRSLLNRFNEFKQQVFNKYDIIAVTETWLTDNIADSAISIVGYTIFRYDRLSRGGGIAVYVKTNIKAVLIKIDINTIEQLWVRICAKNEMIAFGILYRPPSFPVNNFIHILEETIAHLYPTYPGIIIAEKYCLTLNPSKSVVMLFGRRQAQRRVIHKISIKINSVGIPLTNKTKNLGVYIDTSLTFSDHISHILRRGEYYCVSSPSSSVIDMAWDRIFASELTVGVNGLRRDPADEMSSNVSLEADILVPATEDEWKKIERGFNTRWNIPGAHGAIDGKHICIQAPPDCGSDYFNYKGSNSIVIMAVVDDDYCFMYTNIGANGRCSDGGVFQNCSIFRDLENNMLPNNGFFVGDDAFPLKPYLLKPYKHSPLTYEQKIFNYRLSRARRIVQNAFGILASRFRIFRTSISTNLTVTDRIVRTTCTIHNWLRKTSRTYLTTRCVDYENLETGEMIPGLWRDTNFDLQNVQPVGSNHSSRMARQLRERYTNYFVNEGALSWQSRMIH